MIAIAPTTPITTITLTVPSSQSTITATISTKTGSTATVTTTSSSATSSTTTAAITDTTTTTATNATATTIYDQFNISTSSYIYTSNVDNLFDGNDGTNGTTPNVTFINFYYNDSSSPVFPSYIRTTSMVFCIVIMCLGVIGNVMVPIVIFKTKDMRNSTNIFLVNLSVADLMVLLVCTPTVLVEVNSKPETWVLGEEMCKAVPFVELTVAHASVLTILAISFERYYAICKPLKAGYICTKARASLICLLAWFVAAVFTSPILGIAVYHHVDYFDGSIVPACQTLANTFWSALYFLSSIFLFFIVPFVVLIVLYLVIAKNLISNAATVVLNKHLDNYSIRARKQVILMLGTVVLSFFVCLIPFRVFILWIIVVPEEKVYQLGVERYYNILYFCRIMVYLNSAINPILYNLMSSKFRTGFIVCSESRRRLYFKRTRNGTFSTTATSYRSSTLRNNSSSTTTNDGYRVYFRQRNNSLIRNEPIGSEKENCCMMMSTMTGCSGTACGNSVSGPVNKSYCYAHRDHFNDVIRIDEANESTDDDRDRTRNTNSIYDNYCNNEALSVRREASRCCSVTEEEVIVDFHQKFARHLSEEESFV